MCMPGRSECFARGGQPVEPSPVRLSAGPSAIGEVPARKHGPDRFGNRLGSTLLGHSSIEGWSTCYSCLGTSQSAARSQSCATGTYCLRKHNSVAYISCFSTFFKLIVKRCHALLSVLQHTTRRHLPLFIMIYNFTVVLKPPRNLSLRTPIEPRVATATSL